MSKRFLWAAVLLLLISPNIAYSFGAAPTEVIADQEQDEPRNTTGGQDAVPDDGSEFSVFKNLGVPERPLQQALDFFEANRAKIRNDRYITIIDFTQASTRKRMYLLDRESRRVERYYVAHASKTGDKYATSFSNVSGSNKSSLGFGLTAELYTGKYGLSMRLDGLESTNSRMRQRAIVMHGAWYVSEDVIRQYGRLGRSLGCPALEERYIEDVIRRIHGGSLIYQYHERHL